MMMGLHFMERSAVQDGLYPRPRPRREGAEDVEVERQRHRPDRHHRQIWLRRAALYARQYVNAGPRYSNGGQPHRRQPQLRHQIMERDALLPDERMRVGGGVRSGQRRRRRSINGSSAKPNWRQIKLPALLDEHRFDLASNASYEFVWNNFCDWYLEFTKPILLGTDEAAKAETRATTAWVLEQILHILHPFMPFITEELWAEFTGSKEMLIVAKWPELKRRANPSGASGMNWLVRLIIGDTRHPCRIECSGGSANTSCRPRAFRRKAKNCSKRQNAIISRQRV